MVINLLGHFHSSTLVLLPARETFILRSQQTRMQILSSIQQNQGHSSSHSSPTGCPEALFMSLHECWHKSFVQSGDSTVVSGWDSLQHGHSPAVLLSTPCLRWLSSHYIDLRRRSDAICWQMNSIIRMFIPSLKRACSFLHSILSSCAQWAVLHKYVKVLHFWWKYSLEGYISPFIPFVI